MIIKLLYIILYVTYILPLTLASTKCNRSCGKTVAKHLPFPFGFSSGCQIPLNCTSNGTMAIGEFAVETVTSDSILVSIPAQCGRPFDTLRHLFNPNYAPTSQNGILLKHCTTPLTPCVIPNTMIQTHFELLDCGPTDNNNISCYSEPMNKSMFIDYYNLTRSKCSSLFSAISVASLGNINGSAVSLDVQVVKLGWWIEGDCKCSGNANCTRIVSPVDDRLGYRCECLEGYVGDGYRDNLGCRKDSTACKPSKYLAGQCGSATRVGVFIGGVVVVAALFVSLGLMCCFIRRKRSKSKTRNKTKRQICDAEGISIPLHPYKEIEKATNFFSDKRRLGTGAYGTVYLGKLHNDEWVAIKRIKHRDTDSIEQVINEIKLISSVNHRNLVRLLGCSIENGEQIVVYEYMANGTLSQHLEREKGSGLAWPIRLTIAAETAQAIAYLHNVMNPPIYHRDIKSSNILLDYDYKAKVADFGLSRLGMTELAHTHISTAPQGTPGYVDPQYHQNFHLSDKSDVYSFGVVLVEIITGLKVVDFSRPTNEVNLANLAIAKIGKGCLEEIIDPFLEPNMDDWVLSSLHKVAEIAFRCLAFDRAMRPSMMEVAIELEQIGESRWVSAEKNIMDSSNASSWSSSSSLSQRSVGLIVNNPDQSEREIYMPM